MTKGHEAMRRLFCVKRDRTGNLSSLPTIFPDQLAPVVRIDSDGQRAIEMMRWGFPPRPNPAHRPVTTVRNLEHSYWRPWLTRAYRCLVPATSFCEYPDSPPKIPHWFALGPTRPLFAFAGIWRPWICELKGKTKEHLLFSVLMTAPNAIVEPIYAKAMPVMLTTAAEFDAWLDAGVDEALMLQRPLPADLIKIVAKGFCKDTPGSGSV